jgi:hypothetical protein
MNNRLLALFILCSLSASAQKINVELTAAPFRELVRSIEGQTNYRIYHKPTETDTLSITYAATDQDLSLVLRNILGPKGFRFAVDPRQKIYVTKNDFILTEFNNPVRKQETVLLRDFNEDSPDEISVENMVFEIGRKETAGAGEKYLSGQVRLKSTGLPVAGATVALQGSTQVVETDAQGYYSIKIPQERQVLLISSVGLKETRRQLLVYSSGTLNVDMTDQVYSLNEVVVSGERGNQVKRIEMGLEKLNIKTIRQTPAVFGEADVISVLLTLPGVQTVGEAANGFNVRGGATDQNLVLFSDATIFNSSHFFGLFSAFNPDAVQGVELYKSSIPARFGGRLSSVLEVNSKEGNRKKLAGSGGIGLLTGRLSLDGPLSDKTQFFLGGRSTYSDWLLKVIPDDAYKNSKANFYDLNANLSHYANEKDAFYLNFYSSQDKFSFQNGVTYGYRNANVNGKWKRIFNPKTNAVLTVGHDRYGFSIEEQAQAAKAYTMDYGITQSFLKAEVSQLFRNRHKFSYGLNSTYYRISPGTRKPNGAESLVNALTLEQEQALETALFFSDAFTVSDLLSIEGGIRYVMYNYLGARTVHSYAEGLPKSEDTRTGTEKYDANKIIKTYHRPEFRLGVRFALSNQQSIKLGYNSLQQYIHMLSNTTAATPTDAWKLSDTHIKPQYGDQISLGYYQNFPSKKLETSVEAYYKRIHHYLDYKSGAMLLMNENIETDVLGTEAKAYGIEFLVKKTSGKLNGWLSYTLSKVQQRSTGEEKINGGKYYNANFDKPHNLTFVGNWRFSHRYSFSMNTTYSTGRPITLPIAKYEFGGSERVYYSDRNKYRVPDFFRMDLSLNIEGNHKIKKLAHSFWTVGVYNVTGRKNPFSVYYVSEDGKLNGYKLSIFGHQIPFITYNFRF